MVSKQLRTMLILFLATVFVLSATCGCETTKTYTTIIRVNPNGVTEEWKTCSGIIWKSDGSIIFTPLKLSHSIRITGNLTVYKTVVIIKTKTEEKKKK